MKRKRVFYYLEVKLSNVILHFWLPKIFLTTPSFFKICPPPPAKYTTSRHCNQYTVKDSFSFVKEISSLSKQSYCIASFNVSSLLNNIPLDESIHICVRLLLIVIASLIVLISVSSSIFPPRITILCLIAVRLDALTECSLTQGRRYRGVQEEL